MAKNKKEMCKSEIEQENPVLSILEEVGVTPSEIVDLSVSEREQSLLASKKESEGEIEVIQKETAEAKLVLVKIEKKEKVSITSKALKRGKEVKRIMEKAGLEKLSVVSEVEIEFTDCETIATVEIRQGAESSSYYSSSKVEATFKYPANIKILHQRKVIKEQQQVELAAKKKLLALKKDIAGIATHERMARGAIVKAKLAQTIKGKALLLELESIKGNLKTLSYSGG